MPDDVAVIDAQGGLILGADDAATGAGNNMDRAAALKKSVERLLEARVGYGNALVEVSVDIVTDRESIVEHTFDPKSRVVISTDTEERSTTSKDARGGSVSVASNLPEGDGANDSSSSSENSETRERTNYEVSETQREIIRSPGAIKRLTVAVLIDGAIEINDAGEQVFSPRSEEEMSGLRDLVAAAVGFDEARGDLITLKSMEFKPIVEQGSAAAPSFMQSLNLNVMSIIQIAVLGIVTLILGLFVVRPILNSKPSPALAELPPPPNPVSPAPFPEGLGNLSGSPLPALTGEIDDGSFSPPAMAMVSDFEMPDMATAAISDFGDVPGLSNDPVARLRKMIEERQDETVEVLRGWMEDSEETV